MKLTRIVGHTVCALMLIGFSPNGLDLKQRRGTLPKGPKVAEELSIAATLKSQLLKPRMHPLAAAARNYWLSAELMTRHIGKTDTKVINLCVLSHGITNITGIGICRS